MNLASGANTGTHNVPIKEIKVKLTRSELHWEQKRFKGLLSRTIHKLF